MLLQERRGPRPEGGRPRREVLTALVPAHESILRGLPSDYNLAVARAACKAIWSWRNRWDVSRRLSNDANAWLAAGGFKSWWTKADAERAYRTAFASGAS